MEQLTGPPAQALVSEAMAASGFIPVAEPKPPAPAVELEAIKPPKAEQITLTAPEVEQMFAEPPKAKLIEVPPTEISSVSVEPPLAEPIKVPPPKVEPVATEPPQTAKRTTIPPAKSEPAWVGMKMARA